MYICKFCGFMSRDDSTRSCSNRICRGYESAQDDVTAQARFPNRASIRSCTAYTYSAPESASVYSSGPPSAHPVKPPVRPPVVPQMPSDAHQLAFATVPFQKANQTLPKEKWLILGTIFPELARPYTKKIFDRG